ncbi:MAG: member of Set1p complex, histone methyl transferase [Heterodermia speciosa]|uniref:Member of Set1p complex, histone methyl transferase n=1 Tax=Heterodermia speciosa TaxID=116794 RepID=A0A8H3EJL6_9LECA|nr:MAG: member of Set1p complex, histone methyl transferase [Heterodermia speciosa]
MAIPPPPPPPGAPQPNTQKTSDIIGSLRPIQRFKPHKPDALVTSLDFDDTGEFLVATSTDDSLQLFNAKEGKLMKRIPSEKYGAHLARFTHHSSNIIYATTKTDNRICYLDTHEAKFLYYFSGHTEPVTALAVHPGEDKFISCSLDDTVRLWNLKSKNPQARLNLATPHLAAFDPSGSVIAIASSSTSSILLYDIRNFDKPPFATFDLRSLEQQQQPQSQPNPDPTWTKLEFSNDGKWLLVASNAAHGHILLDAFEGALKAFCTRSPNPNAPFAPLRATPGTPLTLTLPAGQGDVCFSADGRYLIGSAATDRDAVVWDMQASVVRGAAGEGEKVLRPVAGLPSGRRTAVSEWNPRYNMLATADRDVVFWLPDEHSGMKPP